MPFIESTISGKSINLTTVAMRAEVSTATVSRVLNGSPSVSTATREKVLKASYELGYVPNPRFRWMGRNRQPGNNRKTGQIGVLMAALNEGTLIGNPYYSRMFISLEQAARSQRQHLITSTLDSSNERFLPSLIKDLNVDGVICIDAFDDGLVTRLQQLMPVVALNLWLPQELAPSVVTDEDSGMRQILEYLISLGHQRICFFGIEDYTAVTTPQHHPRRLDAFRRYCREWNLSQAQIVTLPSRKVPLRQVMQAQLANWLGSAEPPTAVVCSADCYAVELIDIASEQGIKLPERLSIVGIDDEEVGRYLRPRLTTIRQPLEAMSVAAMRALSDLIDNPNAVPATQTMDVMLIKRDSCAAVHK